MNSFDIPDTTAATDELLGELSRTAEGNMWRLIALLSTRVRVQEGRGRPKIVKTDFNKVSPEEFAELGIHGLRSKNTVRALVLCWVRACAKGLAVPLKAGDIDVRFPAQPWTDFYGPQADKDKAVAEAIAADARGVANKAWAEIRQDKEDKEEQNQALLAAALENKITGLIDEHGYTREQAETAVEEERRELENSSDRVEARRKYWRSEIRKMPKQCEKLRQRFYSVNDAAAGDDQIIGGEDRLRLAETYQELAELLPALQTLLNGEVIVASGGDPTQAIRG